LEISDMADSAAPGGAKLPSTFGEKLSFSLPVILVTLILAVGIAFAITMIIDGKTFDKLTAQIEEEKQQRNKKVSDLERANTDLQNTVTAVKTANEDLAKKNKALGDELGKVGETLSTVSTVYKKFVEGQVQLDQTQTKDIASTKEDVNKVDRRVTYIEEKIKKLDEIAKDVDSLKGDTKELKAEYTVLRGDLDTTKKKADITDKDLTELSERARLFQLRVLAARAREAADAARATDLKNLLDRLGDVDNGGK
jgi:chromosome segregation ATPase